MAQGYDKYELDNQTGQSFRFALNDILEASATQNSGDNSPNTTNTSYPYQVWVDTTNDIVKIRDAATAGSWYSLYSVDSDGKPTGAVSYGSYSISTNDTAGNGGTTAITVDTSQRVGIATTSPLSLVDVKNSTDNHILASSATDYGGNAWVGTTDAGGEAFMGIAGSSIGLSTNQTRRVTIDSSGDIGIDTTAPYGGSVTNRRHVTVNGTSDVKIQWGTGGTERGYLYADATNLSLINTQNGYLRLNTNNTERVRIDNSGNVGLGASTFDSTAAGRQVLELNGASSALINLDTAGVRRGYIYQDPTNLYFINTQTGPMYLGTNNTIRCTLTATGYLKSSNTGGYFDLNSNYHESYTSYQDWTHVITNAHTTTPYGVLINHTQDNNNTGNWFFYCQGSTNLRMQVRSNGGIANYQSNNANLCDEREKKNIEALDSTWGCLKNWDLKKFHYNEDADTDDKRYGVIAQQVAPHCPEVITEWVKQQAKDAVLDEDGNVTTPAQEEIVRMGVKEQQMMWMAVKALQEAQTRIETLEAKVAALESA